jgi:hypothetical protein
VATLCIRHNSIIKRERQTQRDSERERERVSKNHAVETSTCPHLGSFAGEGPFSRTDGQNTRTKVFFFFFFFFFLNVFLFCFCLFVFLNYKKFKFFKHPIFFLFFFLSLLGRLPSLCPITEERLPLTNAIISYFGLITFLIPATEMDCNTFYADASKDRFDHHSVNDRWE